MVCKKCRGKGWCWVGDATTDADKVDCDKCEAKGYEIVPMAGTFTMKEIYSDSQKFMQHEADLQAELDRSRW